MSTVVDTPVGPVRQVEAAGRVVNTDPTQYLECRQRHLLAYLSAAAPAAADLLGCAVLGSTRDYFLHCAVRQEPRWALLQDIAGDTDLAALGVQVTRPVTAGPADLPLVRDLVADDQPVGFYAPGGDVPYWADFLRSRGKPDGGGRGAHHLMVCGTSQDGRWLMVLDNANAQFRFRREFVAVSSVHLGAAADPQRWFADPLVLHRTGAPDVAYFADRYRRFVTGLDDRFEAYTVLPDLLLADRARHPDPDEQVAGLDLLRMLAGSRTLFHQFLRHTSHERDVVLAYRDLARTLTGLLTRARTYLTGGPPGQLAGLRRDLLATGAAEAAALRRLRQELAAGPLAVTVAPAA